MRDSRATYRGASVAIRSHILRYLSVSAESIRVFQHVDKQSASNLNSNRAFFNSKLFKLSAVPNKLTIRWLKAQERSSYSLIFNLYKNKPSLILLKRVFLLHYRQNCSNFSIRRTKKVCFLSFQAPFAKQHQK